MKYIQSFNEFINESLVFLTLKDTMKNEFMNDIILKQDFENAKRNFYMNGSFLLTHISGDQFELRSHIKLSNDDVDGIISSRINSSTKRMKFRRINSKKTDIIKDHIWILKANLN